MKARKSGYTRSVTWRRAIATVVLTILAGWPVAATACAMACSATPAQVASHHGMGQGCEESTSPSGPQVGDASRHDCSTHDPAVRQPATVSVEHMRATAWSAELSLTVPFAEASVNAVSDGAIPYSSPPGTATPAFASIVLRI